MPPPPSHDALDHRSPDRGLDGLNLLLAAMGSAYGAFIPVYLTAHAWTQTRIGLVLTVSTIVSMLCQIPAGLLVDYLGPARRRVLVAAVAAIGITPVLLAVLPRELPVMLAMTLQAAAGSVLTPVIAAVSLAVAGRASLGERLGRNARYGSIGAGAGAAVMGACSTWLSERAVFVIAAALVVPALYALRRIGPGTEEAPPPTAVAGVEKRSPLDLLRDRRVVVFAACITLFQVSSIAILQIAAVEVTARTGARSGLVIAGFLIVPQIIVALLSPAIGRAAQRYGRRAVLLTAFAMLPLRGALFAMLQSPFTLLPVQMLEGASGAAFGVMMPLVAADLTRGTGRYNLCLGLFGLASGIGAAISTVLAGWVSDHFGRPAAFWALGAAGLAAVLLLALALAETRPEEAAATAPSGV